MPRKAPVTRATLPARVGRGLVGWPLVWQFVAWPLKVDAFVADSRTDSESTASGGIILGGRFALSIRNYCCSIHSYHVCHDLRRYYLRSSWDILDGEIEGIGNVREIGIRLL